MDNTIPNIFNRELYLQRQAKASPAKRQALVQRISEDVVDRLALITRSFDRALLIAAPEFQGMLGDNAKISALTRQLPRPDDNLGLATATYDAAFSVLDLHTVNDVPGYLSQLATCLKPDGLLMLAFFAGDTLFELRQSWLAAESEMAVAVTPRIAPMIGVRELGGLLQRAGLALPVADLDRAMVRYDNAFALMQDVKVMGYANPLTERSHFVTPRRLISRVAEHYHQHFTDADGRIHATFEIAWANAWKPHPSQQQPLKPGSAKARLADALRATETKI